MTGNGKLCKICFKRLFLQKILAFIDLCIFALHPALYKKSLTSLLQCLNFRSSCPELFFKKVALKNFARFIGVSSGTGASSEFCDILKNPFFAEHLQVVASGICNIQYFLFYGEIKDFIFTCIFLRIITFFIKI